jgi:hypothetical protein
MQAYTLLVCRKHIKYLHKQYMYNQLEYNIGYREDKKIGCLVNYKYVYCPEGTKVYGTGGKFATGQSKTMFMGQTSIAATAQ